MDGSLDELFTRLKSQSSDQSSQTQSSAQPSLWMQPQSQPHQQPSVSSPLISPPSQTPNPVHSSNIISPVNPASAVGTPAPPDQSKTNNLLNLLRSSSQAGHHPAPAGPMATLQNVGRSSSGSFEILSGLNRDDSQSRSLFAQDLSALQRNHMPAPRTTVAGAEKTDAPQSHDSKQFLLNLLKKPSSAAPAAPPHATIPKSSDESSPVRHFGSPVTHDTPFEAPQATTQSSAFNYVNPFEQLHSSSPLNRTPQPQGSQPEPKKVEILKHERDVSSSVNVEGTAPVAKSRRIEGGPGSPSPVRAETEKAQTVSQALEDIGEKVDKQVEVALKKADAQGKVETIGSAAATPRTDTIAAASSPPIKKEPGVDDGVDSSWESAEDEEAEKAGEDFQVEVFNLPMKAWVSIQVKSLPNPLPVRQDSLTFIARMKKDFDQIDRNLVTASQTHIIYAPVPTKKVPHPGLRIIQQEFGQHKHVFTSTNERMFNVQICNSANDVETVLGTGINGSIFWTSLSKSRGELFADDDVDAQGFIMPPVATPEEQTSGSPVKTRAKVSSRHPEFFGVARGKQIHIISPDAVKNRPYYNSKTRMVNSEKYLADHSLMIMTGKAGKDFCFSEDDTVIVSLDKSGKFKFWDIRELTSRATDISEDQHEPVELREPMLTHTAAASGSRPDEKPSVSSIMFIDKERPTLKGVALRYMLIGFKQNHILQLWDLGLGKAVQELRLPHEKDSDGICSITYQPRNGIIAIGHPTRNSIFFIHLSAPMYRLPNVDQARYISVLARGDPAFPKPQSTAIMSGIRELSFAKVGQLRSLDMLRTPPAHAGDPDTDDAVLFELYVMHSKGVVGLDIKKRDLGWNNDSKPLKPVDAVNAGAVEVSAFIAPDEVPAPSEVSTETPSKFPKASASKKEAKASASAKDDTVKRATASTPQPNTIQQSTTINSTQQSKPTNHYQPRAKTPEAPLPSEEQPAAPRVSSDGDLQAMLRKHFDALYDRVDADKRVVDAAASARQDAMLRLVSSTLTENVEKSLQRIVSASIEEKVIPGLSNTVAPVVEKQLADKLSQQLSTIVSREVKASIPQAVQQALKDAQVQRSVSDQVAAKVQQQVSQLLEQSMPGIATKATQKMITDLDSRTKQQMRELETRRVHDASKIHELSELVRGLSETVSKMSDSQRAFQDEIRKLQQGQDAKPGAAPGQSTKEESSAPPDPQTEAEDAEVAKITQLLTSGQYDAATLEWLQSARQGELFDLIFVRVNPRYLEQVSPLVALSVSAAITASFGSYVEQRLDWLATVLNNIDMNDEDIRDVAGKIMDVLSQRLQGAYMQASEAGQAGLLKRISGLHRQVSEVRQMAG